MWSDFGGKRQQHETAWDTACRELLKEGGISLHTPPTTPIFHTHSAAKAIIYLVHTTATPQPNTPTILQIAQFKTLPANLHPRLKYDNHGLIRRALNNLFQTRANSTLHPAHTTTRDPDRPPHTAPGTGAEWAPHPPLLDHSTTQSNTLATPVNLSRTVLYPPLLDHNSIKPNTSATSTNLSRATATRCHIHARCYH